MWAKKGYLLSDNLGDISAGRPNLGPNVPVKIYRLMQYAFHDVLRLEYDEDTAKEIFYKAGKLAGEKFCQEYLDTSLDLASFLTKLKNTLIELKIGILRVEELEANKMNLVLTIAEDLDCSGLPITGEPVCSFDEGFLAGLMEAYTGQSFKVKEIDCWATGDTVCRFNVVLDDKTANQEGV